MQNSDMGETAQPGHSVDTSLGALARLALPAALTLLLGNAYRFNDLYFVQLLGGEHGVAAQAAVSVAGMVTILCFAFYEGIAVGVLALSSRAHGSGEAFRARRILRIGIALSCGVACAILAFGMTNLEPLSEFLLGWSQESEASRSGEALAALRLRQLELDALRAYLTPCFLGALALCLSPVVSHAFLAKRDSRTPFYLEILAVGINTGLNAWLVPELGAAGAAWATVLSRCVSVSIGLWLLHRVLPRDGGVDARSLATILARIARVGLPTTAAIGIYSCAYQVVLATSFPPFGPVGRATLGNGFTIEGLAFCLIWGLAQAVGSLAGNALGAGDAEKAREVVRRGVRVVLVLVFPLTLLFLFGASALASVMTEDPATHAAVVVYLQTIAWSQWAVGIQGVQENALYSSGYAMPPALASAFWNLTRIPLCFVFAHSLGFGLVGIWWAINVSSYGKGLTVTWLTMRGRWLRVGAD